MKTWQAIKDWGLARIIFLPFLCSCPRLSGLTEQEGEEKEWKEALHPFALFTHLFLASTFVPQPFIPSQIVETRLAEKEASEEKVRKSPEAIRNLFPQSPVPSSNSFAL